MRISDWSSDVCSSDLIPAGTFVASRARPTRSEQQPEPTQGTFELTEHVVGGLNELRTLSAYARHELRAAVEHEVILDEVILENTFQKDRILAAVPGDQDALVRIVDDKLISADIPKSNVVKRSWPGGKIENDILAAVSIDNERVEIGRAHV